MLLLSKNDIKKIVNMQDMIEASKQLFSLLSLEKIDSPLRTIIGNGAGGSFLTMPSFCGDMGVAAVKVVDVFPENSRKELKTIYAQVMLMDGETGQFLSLLDGTYITQLRTGAATGAALDLLAKKDCHKGALIGTGAQAETQLEAMITVRVLEEVSVYSPNFERCMSFVERMRAEHPTFRGTIIPAVNVKECVCDADIIVTVTTSSEPVFDGHLVKPGATVSGVGTYEPNKHELDSALLSRASRIFCDSVDAVLNESGDILIPLHEGIISLEDISGSIGDVINKTVPGRKNDEEIIVFETVGIAAQDLAAAKLIYEKAKTANVGINWG